MEPGSIESDLRDEQDEEQRACIVQATSTNETDTVHAILALKSLLSLIKHEGVSKTKQLFVKVMYVYRWRDRHRQRCRFLNRWKLE